ncbi:hypothetical protein [Kozakia baliensis]|nr:hypothetical protein [Kozakia baliensis]
MTRFVKSLLLFGSIAALGGCNHPLGQSQDYHEPNQPRITVCALAV